MLHTSCRVSEALALTLSDIQGGYVTFRRSITKGKIGTRTIPITTSLELHLDPHLPSVDHYLFPGRHGRGRLTRNGADWILRQACQRIALVGVSTHSFRRTALTMLHNGGIPLRTIQTISGHQSLATLQGYLEVRPDQVAAAVELIGF
jgi:integrase/recombinase XerD